ncbi:MAG TPA: lipase maturation factor family protein [Myxococcales bacterium]|nr:lipase maturation factor family protein [Myxococcales bacterium]
MRPDQHQLTRFLMLRLLGLVYLVAFAIFLQQGPALVGHRGLLPADLYLSEVAQTHGGAGASFWKLPTVFWLSASDPAMAVAGWAGLLLSAAVMLGLTNAAAMFVLWALYLSVVHVGQLFWGYGWETQLCETGFLAIFLCPLRSFGPLPQRPPPPQVIWLFRWLIARMMLGAGLIKLRGDPCWRELTCLDYHFLTQPIPNPLSASFHFAPRWVHAAGVLFNDAAELVAPVFAFGPKLARRISGGVMIAFQLALIASGNLSFLNWLTIIPALACFDDQLLGRAVPARWRERAGPDVPEPDRVHMRVGWAVALLVAVLSVEPVLNLLSPHQRMNTSFGAFALVNTYGAFGSVGKVRHEIVFEGTNSADPEAPDSRWRPYEFKCKPGDPDRRPCVVSPYHLRLDWQIWFAAMSEVDEEPWAIHLVWKLLHGDPLALGLLARGGNPFPDAPPRFIRARLYRYDFAPPGDRAYWRRTEVGEWMPPLSAEDPRLLAVIQGYGWLDR